MAFGATAETESGSETALFFGAEGRRKFAVLHTPRSPAGGDPIVVCAPHFEEKLWAHRVLVGAAREAARRGHETLRFDVSGHGDSEGEFEDFGLSDFVEDTVEAWRWLRERTGRAPAFFGWRLGATAAAIAAGRVGARAVLVEPLLDPSAWVLEMLRGNLTFQIRHYGRVVKNRSQLVAELEAGQIVVLDGYGLTPRFHREAKAASGWAAAEFPGRCPAVLAIALRKRGMPTPAGLSEASGRWGASTRSSYLELDEEPIWSDVRRYRTRAPVPVQAALDWIAAPEAAS